MQFCRKSPEHSILFPYALPQLFPLIRSVVHCVWMYTDKKCGCKGIKFVTDNPLFRNLFNIVVYMGTRLNQDNIMNPMDYTPIYTAIKVQTTSCHFVPMASWWVSLNDFTYTIKPLINISTFTLMYTSIYIWNKLLKSMVHFKNHTKYLVFSS